MNADPNNTAPADPATKPQAIELLARVLWTERGRVLLCKNKGRDYWFLPGGHVEPGETAAHAALRELREEAAITTLTLGPCRLLSEQLFTQTNRKGIPKPRHEYTLVFDAAHPAWPADERIADAPAPVTPAEDHLEFLWADPAQLTDLDLRPPSTKAWLTARPGGLDTPEFTSDDTLTP